MNIISPSRFKVAQYHILSFLYDLCNIIIKGVILQKILCKSGPQCVYYVIIYQVVRWSLDPTLPCKQIGGSFKQFNTPFFDLMKPFRFCKICNFILQSNSSIGLEKQFSILDKHWNYQGNFQARPKPGPHLIRCHWSGWSPGKGIF